MSEDFHSHKCQMKFVQKIINLCSFLYFLDKTELNTHPENRLVVMFILILPLITTSLIVFRQIGVTVHKMFLCHIVRPFIKPSLMTGDVMKLLAVVYHPVQPVACWYRRPWIGLVPNLAMILAKVHVLQKFTCEMKNRYRTPLGKDSGWLLMTEGLSQPLYWFRRKLVMGNMWKKGNWKCTVSVWVKW